jgi:small subunit ribosomal protein S11
MSEKNKKTAKEEEDKSMLEKKHESFKKQKKEKENVAKAEELGLKEDIEQKAGMDVQLMKQRTAEAKKAGILYIYASHNNTIMHLTDSTGAETLSRVSGGMLTKAQHKEGSPYVAMKASELIAQAALEKGIGEIVVKVRAPGGSKNHTPGQGAEASIKSLTRHGLRILRIENITPIPHDRCRPKKRFRTK